MAKSKAEIQKAFRARKGTELKEKEKLRSSRRRKTQTIENKKTNAILSKQRMSKMRQSKKQAAMQANATTPLRTPLRCVLPAYKSRSSETKGIKKIISVLPSSPRKQLVLISKIATDLGLAVPVKCITREKLPNTTITLVQNFYEREDISRWTPGIKEYVCVRDENGEKHKVQKRYLVASLKELYGTFVEEFGKIISFSKFCDLRPDNIYSFSKTPLEACCCLQHKNFINLCNILSKYIPDFEVYSKD